MPWIIVCLFRTSSRPEKQSPKSPKSSCLDSLQPSLPKPENKSDMPGVCLLLQSGPELSSIKTAQLRRCGSFHFARERFQPTSEASHRKPKGPILLEMRDTPHVHSFRTNDNVAWRSVARSNSPQPALSKTTILSASITVLKRCAITKHDANLRIQDPRQRALVHLVP